MNNSLLLNTVDVGRANRLGTLCMFVNTLLECDDGNMLQNSGYFKCKLQWIKKKHWNFLFFFALQEHSEILSC